MPAPERIEFTGAGGSSLVGDRRAAAEPRAGCVLLLHGGGQTRHSWATTAERLAARGWETLAVDTRGHGESAWAGDGGYFFDDLIGDVRAVADTLPEPPVVVGASMGGLTALMAEARHPGLMRALVLVDIAPTMEPDGVAKIADFMRSGTAGFASLDEAADAVAAYNPHRPRPSSPEGLRKNLRLRADGRWYWHWDPALIPNGTDYDRGISQAEQCRLAAGIRIPTLLIRGTNSDVVSLAGARELLDLIPSSRLVDAADAGHMVAGDDNDVFTAELTRFLADVARGPDASRGRP